MEIDGISIRFPQIYALKKSNKTIKFNGESTIKHDRTFGLIVVELRKNWCPTNHKSGWAAEIHIANRPRIAQTGASKTQGIFGNDPLANYQ